jgi:hypothetical protein
MKTIRKFGLYELKWRLYKGPVHRQRFFVPPCKFIPLIWSVLPTMYNTLSTGRISPFVLRTKTRIKIITCSDIIMDDGCSFIVQAAACTASYLLQQCGKPQKKSRVGRVAIRRARRSVREINSTLGADYFRCAYRMSRGQGVGITLRACPL